MLEKMEATSQAHFGNLKDPRRTCLNDHPLINIITIALCAVISGAKAGQMWKTLDNKNKPSCPAFWT